MNSVISPLVEKCSMADGCGNINKQGLFLQEVSEKGSKENSKAEREKSKREHSNELFLSLSNALELSKQINGKASVLDEAICMVKNMIDEINCLGKENAALLSESQYVSMEKKQLQDENSALEAQIGKLQCELKERVGNST